ncbi:hypothetical protein F442_22537 [Phytophthora nicotianae P10297]|uniref:Uncharacterized protein n=1 Tax=Phytophthora nicotianae P10297 TaxID=1317064 RepID=W2Y0K4_PHYNI|nr:hypothetical protein F442_22537 [Phytophthora nicotianae P10297]
MADGTTSSFFDATEVNYDDGAVPDEAFLASIILLGPSETARSERTALPNRTLHPRRLKPIPVTSHTRTTYYLKYRCHNDPRATGR